jgi:hypothetical protein
MKMGKHTPGPWKYWSDNGYGDTRFYIAQEDGAPYTSGYSDVATLIAETVSGEKKAVQEANARLIAAAPDLLGCDFLGERDNSAQTKLVENRLSRGQEVAQLKVLVPSKLVLASLFQLAGCQANPGLHQLLVNAHPYFS